MNVRTVSVSSFVWAQSQKGTLNALTAPAYNPATDVFRARQAQFFPPPQISAYSTTRQVYYGALTPVYNPATDVPRSGQARVFVNSQASAYTVQRQVYYGSNTPSGAMTGSAHVEAQGYGTLIGMTGSSDVLSGMDTFGWPVDYAVPVWQPPQRGWLNTLNPAPYNPTTDVARRRQPQFFVTPQATGYSVTRQLANAGTTTTPLTGAAFAASFAYGSLSSTGLTGDLFGGMDTVGWPEQPAYVSTGQRGSLTVVLTPYGALTGRAVAASFASGSLMGAGALTGTAAAQVFAKTANLLGAGALTGSNFTQVVGYGTVFTGTLANITGTASVNASGYGSLAGAAALTGTASAQSFVFAQPGGIASLTGAASAQLFPFANAGVQVALTGRASASSMGAGTLTGAGALEGLAFAASVSYGVAVGAGALTGTASVQALPASGLLEGAAALEGVALAQSQAVGLLLYVGEGEMEGAATSGFFAYGTLSTNIHAFGWCYVTALSQNGLPVARACYIEESACVVEATYYDISGAPFVPNAVSYRVDDVASDFNIVPWTMLVPALTNEVTVTSAQNAMINLSRQHETHQVLFMITDGNGNVNYARVEFELIRVAGLG